VENQNKPQYLDQPNKTSAKQHVRVRQTTRTRMRPHCGGWEDGCNGNERHLVRSFPIGIFNLLNTSRELEIIQRRLVVDRRR